MSKGQRRRHPLLADREWVRLSLLRKTQAEIARDLLVPSSTVAYHVRRHGLRPASDRRYDRRQEAAPCPSSEPSPS